MRSVATIFKREFLAYFNSPIAYIFVIVFLIVNSGLFTATFFFMNVAEMRYFFTILPITLAVFMPAVTMRMWAEERRTGTIGLLLSLPAKNYELVLGKFLASLVFYFVALAGTLTIPIMLGLAGDPDTGPVVGGYIGAVFLGAFFLSVGLFVSVIFKDQILAFIIAMVLCFGFYLLGTDLVAAPLDGWTGGLGTVIKDVVGLANRLESVERGVVDVGDIIYFLAFTAGFLLLNVYALESRIRMRGASLFPAGVILVLGIAAVISLFTSDMGLGRFDLTENDVYSLTPASKRILAGLKTPVTVRYYATPRDRMPTYMKNIERDVRDELEEFARHSRNFEYEIIDPTGDVETQKKLQERDIVPFTVQSFEKDTREMKLVYSTISIMYLDKKEEIIPRIMPQELGQLEYAIISRIYRMTLENKPTIAVYAPVQYQDARLKDESFREMLAKMGRPVPPPQDRFGSLKQMLREEGYEVADVELEAKSQIPDDAKTLVVLEPEGLKPEQLKRIEKFAAQGKNLFIAVQKYAFTYNAAPQGGMDATPSKTDSGIDPFLRKYGLTIPDNILMDESAETINITVQRRMGNMMFRGPERVKLPVQILVVPENMSSETGVTDRLSGLTYMWGSVLALDEEVVEKAGLKHTTLFTTSPDSWTLPGKTTPLERQDINPAEHKKTGKQPLAILFEGPVPGTGDKGKNAKVIIVGCGEMFTDNLLGWRSNAIFLLNSVDSLSLSEDLVSVRSKGSLVRMIRNLSDGEKLFYRFLTLGLVPVIFAALGVTRSVVRRRRRAAYLRKFSQ